MVLLSHCNSSRGGDIEYYSKKSVLWLNLFKMCWTVLKRIFREERDWNGYEFFENRFPRWRWFIARFYFSRVIEGVASLCASEKRFTFSDSRSRSPFTFGNSREAKPLVERDKRITEAWNPLFSCTRGAKSEKRHLRWHVREKRITRGVSLSREAGSLLASRERSETSSVASRASYPRFGINWRWKCVATSHVLLGEK